MYAQSLIVGNLPTLNPLDNFEQALATMTAFHVQHLPVVDENGQYLGLLEEHALIDIEHLHEHHLLTELNFANLRPFVIENQPISELLKVFIDYRITAVPVLSQNADYLGCVTIETVLDYFANLTAAYEPGPIIVVEMHQRDYSLAYLARIIEECGAAVISAYTTTNPDTMLLNVTLKVNAQDISAILAAFERHDITINGAYTESNFNTDLQERYDSLLNYLNI